MPSTEGLLKNGQKRTEDARKKALKAINELREENKMVNFSSVAERSGISRHFLYEDETVKSAIEEQRKHDIDNNMNRRACYDKTAKSKDTIIAAKDRRIAKLERENAKLREELTALRGLVYSKKS